MPQDLTTIIQRVAGTSLTLQQQQQLLEAIQSGQATLATGDRALTVGGNADNAVLITGDRNIVGDRNIIFEGADAEVIRQYLLPSRVGIPENLPRSGVVQFVGRAAELSQLHQQLQGSQQSAVFAISGMGGVGKTELALQYAHAYKHLYQGGACWLQAKGTDIGTQIVQFARSRLELNPSEDLKILEQVGHCWTYWPEGDVLVVIDDVIDYDAIKNYLPAGKSRFKVLLTTRLRLGASIQKLTVEVLEETEALAMLEALIGPLRVQSEIDDAFKIYQWLGGLPLGLELVGRYLNLKEDLPLAKMFQRLQKKRLDSPAIADPDDEEMTARLGVANAFDLSWEMLDETSQELAYLLCLFAPALIPWHLVELCLPNEDEEDLEDLRDQSLVKLHLIQRKRSGGYQLHQLIREFLQDKAELVSQAETLKYTLAKTLAAAASKIPESPTRSLILELDPVIPHIEEVAACFCDCLEEDDLIQPFKGLGHYYEGQGFYSKKEEWYRRCLETAQKRFGDKHPQVAMSLNGIASACRAQGRYSEAQPFCEKGLTMRGELFGDEHNEVADSLNSLGLLLTEKGDYSEAEPIYLKALAIRQKQLPADHPDLADSLDNLGLLYNNLHRYEEAEPLLRQALDIRQNALGKTHPRVATSLNNLACCLSGQGKLEEAKAEYLAALELYKQVVGEEHPEIAITSTNLAFVYYRQDQFSQAEDLLRDALKVNQRILGEEHPNVVNNLNSLAILHDVQGRIDEAEVLYLKVLGKWKQLFSDKHPNVATCLSNLAKFYWLQKRLNDAEPLYLQAINIFEQSLGKSHDRTQSVRNDYQSMIQERDAT
ncbi:tetratricopeptide repeat protein [Leptolyngbya sp. CCNP1308]|uniref:tetratricopeptide repeat protein n=1 Tax=Leptolyngbya sp. CCNP1308 TaxID=3110255 RepID=UPI002B21A7E3|nr:tetratricopeptide repeat protein [Leptolyngbya sp. CCNP1308]MEA5447551.1 tetratricopeptide repeat protein [Leptolyngbya sp. CCNP1308]